MFEFGSLPGSGDASRLPYIFVLRIYEVSTVDNLDEGSIKSELEFVNASETTEHSNLAQVLERIEKILRPKSEDAPSSLKN